MADQFGAMTGSGLVRLPATFHGTATLLSGNEPPVAPKPARFDDLAGRFEADLPVTFGLLRGAGFVPVDASHPAYPAYLQAAAEHESAEPELATPALNPHDPDVLVMPFETTITITEAMSLRFGLVAPSHPAARERRHPHAVPARRKPLPPLHFSLKPGNGPDAAPLPGDDFEAFLRFMGNLERHPVPGPRQIGGPSSPLLLKGVDLAALDVMTPR